MTREEVRQFGKQAGLILTAADISDTHENRKSLVLVALYYREEKEFSDLPRSPGRRDPFERAQGAIATLRKLSADRYARYYLARTISAARCRLDISADNKLEQYADLERWLLGEHGRITTPNPWDTAIEHLGEILDGAMALAAEHAETRGDAKGNIAETWAIWRLALIWRQLKGDRPRFNRSTPSSKSAPTKPTKSTRILARTGFNAFALDFLKALDIDPAAECVADAWASLRDNWPGEFDPDTERFWAAFATLLEWRNRLSIVR